MGIQDESKLRSELYSARAPVSPACSSRAPGGMITVEHAVKVGLIKTIRCLDCWSVAANMNMRGIRTKNRPETLQHEMRPCCS